MRTCDGAPPHHVSIAGDCLDTDPTVQVPPWYFDGDGDGFGAGPAAFACEAPAQHVAAGTDCDDGTDAVSPGVPEICENGIDDDCDDTTRCRLRGNPVAAFEDQWDHLPVFQPGWSMRIGNVVGDVYDDVVLGDRLFEGGPGFDPTSPGIPIFGYTGDGVDLNGDGYNELLTIRDGVGGMLLAGGASGVVPVREFTSSANRLQGLLVQTDAHTGALVQAEEEGTFHFLPLSGPSVPVALSSLPVLLTTPRVELTLLRDQNVLLLRPNSEPPRQIDLDTLLSAAVPLEWDALPLAYPGSSDRVLYQQDKTTQQLFALSLDLTDGTYVQERWLNADDFLSGDPPDSTMAGNSGTDGIPAPFGDIDADGYADQLLGIGPDELEDDQVGILYGRPPSSAPVLPIADAFIQVPHSPFFSDTLIQVGAHHDIDGDGYDDVLAISGSNQAGSTNTAHLFRGSGL